MTNIVRSSLRLSDARRAQLRDVYLLAFDNFATDRTEVADLVFDGSKTKATAALNTLRDVDLLGATDVNDASQGRRRRGGFRELTWQATESYDDISRDEAIARFDATFDPTNRTTNHIGANMPSTTSTTRPVNKTEEKELARHSALREAFKDAFADVETSDHKMDSPEFKKLSEKRDTIGTQLHGVAEKLRKRGYTLRNDDSTPEAPTVTATATPPAPAAPAKPEFSWPRPAKQIVLAYLKARNAPEFDDTQELRPYINANGKVFIHSDDWRQYLATLSLPVEPTKSQAAQPLRELGLVVRATPIPTRDYAKGFYTGDAPKDALSLERRTPKRGGGARGPRTPFGKLDDNQRAMLREALTGMPKSKLKGERGELHAQLLKFIDVADAASTDTDS